MMVRTCCVVNCRSIMNKLNTVRGVSFHLFPKSNLEILSKWVDFLDYGSDWKPLKSSSICSLHFLDTDYRLGTNLRMLKTTAVPSVTNTTPHDISKVEPQETTITDEIQSQGHFGTCRLCSQEFKCGLSNIFDTDNDFPYKIFKCLHLTVSTNDALPPFMCYLCQQKLNDTESFIDDVMKAQEVLNSKNIPLPNDNQGALSFNCNEIEENYPQYDMNIVSSKICYNEVEERHRNFITSCKPSISIIPVEFSKPENYSSTPHNRNDITRDVLLNPIKLEITSNREILGKIQHGSTNTERLNKKIEILEDIKIEPPLNQIAYKSFKTIYDESLSTMNRSTAQKIVQPEIAKIPNAVVPKKKIVVERNKLLSKSTVVCNNCKAKFISKYALNHHVKHLCSKKESNSTKPLKRIKLKKTPDPQVIINDNQKNPSDYINTSPLMKTQLKHKRKAILTVKSEYY